MLRHFKAKDMAIGEEALSRSNRVLDLYIYISDNYINRKLKGIKNVSRIKLKSYHLL